MASARSLISVAHGVAHAFANRDNDVDGWWAPGLLLDSLHGPNPERLNVLTGERCQRRSAPRWTNLAPLGRATSRGRSIVAVSLETRRERTPTY